MEFTDHHMLLNGVKDGEDPGIAVTDEMDLLKNRIK